MSKAKQDAAYLYEHYKQTEGNKGFVSMLFDRIVKQDGLNTKQAQTLANEFKKLLKQG